MKPNESVTEIIDRQDWIDPVADPLQNAIAGAFASQGETGEAVEDFLHGKWLGHSLHSTLTDVPIGAWTVAAVLDVVEAKTGDDKYAPGADAAIAIGLCGAASAAVTGLTDWHKTEGTAKRLGLIHGLLNISATALFASSLVMRKRNDRATGRTLGWLGYAIVSASAYLGGELVYNQKVGVDAPPLDAKEE